MSETNLKVIVLINSLVVGISVLSSPSTANMEITSQDWASWGDWGKMDYCPSGTYAQGFLLKTQAYHYALDDTALNAIVLFCGPTGPYDPQIHSSVGKWGSWGKTHHRKNEIITGFQMNVEKNPRDLRSNRGQQYPIFLQQVPNLRPRGWT